MKANEYAATVADDLDQAAIRLGLLIDKLILDSGSMKSLDARSMIYAQHLLARVRAEVRSISRTGSGSSMR